MLKTAGLTGMLSCSTVLRGWVWKIPLFLQFKKKLTVWMFVKHGKCILLSTFKSMSYYCEAFQPVIPKSNHCSELETNQDLYYTPSPIKKKNSSRTCTSIWYMDGKCAQKEKKLPNVFCKASSFLINNNNFKLVKSTFSTVV